MIQWYSDMLLILARVLKAAEVLWLDKSRWLAFLWPLLLLPSAILVISYRKPEGAYETELPSQHQMEAGHQDH